MIYISLSFNFLFQPTTTKDDVDRQKDLPNTPFLIACGKHSICRIRLILTQPFVNLKAVLKIHELIRNNIY